MRYILLLAVLGFSTAIHGQGYFQKTISSGFGNTGSSCIINTSDGGYAISGATGVHPNTMGYVAKLDNAGNLIWANSYYESDFTMLYSIVQTFDGGYAVTGRAGYLSFKMLVMKLSSTGALQWSYTFNLGDFDLGNSIVQTADSGYAIGGRAYTGFDYIAYVLKLDKSGNFQWDATTPGFEDGVSSIVQTSDLGYGIAGITGGGASDIIFAKLSSNGTTQWTRSVGGAGSDMINRASKLVYTNDGGFAIAGFTNSFGAGSNDAYVIKLNALGSLLWTRVIGTTASEYGYSLVQTTDQGYLLAGSTSANGYDGNIIKLDNNGVVQWSKTVGSSGGEEFYSVVQSSDGGYMAAGGSGTNLYLVKFNSAGATCDTISQQLSSTTGGAITIINGTGGSVGGSKTQVVPAVNSGGYINPLCSCLITAGISASGPTTFCTGGSVSLNANTGTGITYQWYKNSVLISGAVSASYIANTSGSYTVIENSSCGSSTSNSITVTVNSSLAATITAAGPTSFCSGGSVVLNANTGAGITYQWYKNSAIISGAVNASYTASTPGSYYVTETSSCGSTSSNTISVTVNSLPAASITASGPTTFCTGGSVSLNANTGSGISYQWYKNSVLISGAVSASYIANATGSYYVNETSSCGTTASNSISVTVNSPPAATITAAGSTTFCSGGSVTLFANNIANTTYQWYLNSAVIPGATNTTYSANASGNYTVAEKSLCGTVTSNIINVTVNPLPEASITPGGNVGFCSTGITLQANTGTGLSYQWKRNNVNITGATGSSYLANTSGSYSVLVTSGSGCSKTSLQVNVSGPPSNTISASGPTYFCTGGSVTLSCISDQPVTYTWKKNGATINGAISQTYVATSAAQYNCIVTNNYGCTKAGTQIKVTIGPPDATITANGPTSFCAGGSVQLSAVSGYSYQWLRNGSNIAGALQQTYTATTAGKYKVTVTDQWGCTKTTSNSGQISVNISCRATETYIKDVAEMVVVPNPSNGKFELQITSENEKVSFQIYSPLGELVQEQTIDSNIPFSIDFTTQPEGVYFIHAVSGNRKLIQKVVKL